uniref:Uncharacterized protein n=1 Tax=Anguilla anguilla TaxID=7936 RepID=A0A0E9VPV8_ANGAN
MLRPGSTRGKPYNTSPAIVHIQKYSPGNMLSFIPCDSKAEKTERHGCAFEKVIHMTKQKQVISTRNSNKYKSNKK